MKTHKKIPYGISSYKTIKQENYYYVDKSRYLPQLEDTGKFLFLIRPRRFGKSSLMTMLECYYDIARKEEFNFLFQGTHIADHPTPEKNAHLFEIMGYHQKAYEKLEFLLNYIGFKGLKVYVLIDEYDNFTNTILTTAGQKKYHELTHGAGFLRHFFNVLKGAVDQADSGICRMFITGVSPVTMDDVTSGFNIGRNISLNPAFNELLGFTEQDVINILKYYSDNSGSFQEQEKLLSLMKEWYDHYRFSEDTHETLFNTDMVLYFVKSLSEAGKYPRNMIDQNVKINYGKLRHLIVLDQRLNSNFSYLSEIIKTEGTSAVQVVESFPVERLMKPSNFISLLFYFGLLSYSNTGNLQIPNRTVKLLMYSYLREGYEDVNVFSVYLWRFANQISDMAYNGEWKPVFQFLADEVKKQTSIRDYLTGEKVIQTFLLAYLNVTDYYITRTEEEMGKGFADMYLEPFLSKYPDVSHSYLIELKYLARTDFSEDKLHVLVADAENQLRKYAADERIIKRTEETSLKCLALVFCGWEMKAAVDF